MIQGIIAIFILATIFGGIALVIGVFFWSLKTNRGLSTGKNAELQADETRIIQEIYQGFNKMEKRIEALETILLEQQNEEKKE